MAAKVKPADVRAAREFLRKRGVRGFSPYKFARSSMETGMSYRSLLTYLAGVARKVEDDSERRKEEDDAGSVRARG